MWRLPEEIPASGALNGLRKQGSILHKEADVEVVLQSLVLQVLRMQRTVVMFVVPLCKFAHTLSCFSEAIRMLKFPNTIQ